MRADSGHLEVRGHLVLDDAVAPGRLRRTETRKETFRKRLAARAFEGFRERAHRVG